MKFTTGTVRLSYAHLFVPQENKLSGEKNYSVSLLIDKKDTKTVNRLKALLKKMLADPENIKKWDNKTKGLRTPLRDGDEEREDDPNYAGHYFLNAKSSDDHKPKVLDDDLVPITDPSEVYSGCYAQAVITLYPYNQKGNRGIGAGLLAIRKVRDGEPLGGSVVTEDDWNVDGDDDTDDLF